MPRPKTFRPDDDVLSFLKTYEKDHKCKSLSDAINQIIREKALQKPITSDVPLGEPINPEKQKAIQELKQEALTPLPPPPCNYVSKGYIDSKLNIQMVFCDNPSRKLKGRKEPMSVALAVCQKCWERREWVKAKKEREQEEGTQQIEQTSTSIWEKADNLPYFSHWKDRLRATQNIIEESNELPHCTNIYRLTTKLKGHEGEKFIYCMEFGDWKTPDFCQECFSKEKPHSPNFG